MSASRDDLSHLISQLLEKEGREFDFLIGGALLRSQLGKVIEQLQINTVGVNLIAQLFTWSICLLSVCLFVCPSVCLYL